MGSSCKPNGQSIDSAVGGLVWVRRRNGSWWPAQILGLDELPEGCLVSTKRSGTPVKLLGREDVSVDWYNLEKSKRVKPFRCGEYDECIERAKVTASINCGKASKYARREDAILHALEIENFQLSKNNNLEHVSDKSSGLDFISVSPQELSRTAASPDDSLEDMMQETQNESEDGETEGSKRRMRGLEDLGVGGAVSPFKKKRSRVVHIHDFLKKKSRRCQLTKVMKRTEMVTIPVMSEGLADLNRSGFPDAEMWEMEYKEVKGSFSDGTSDAANKQKEFENSSVSELLETDDSSGRLFDVPFIKEEKQTAGSSPALEPETGLVGTQPKFGQSSPVETVSVVPNEFQESSYISSGADISHIIDNNGSSKWQHKGKRKSRNKSKTKPIMSFLTPDDESREVNGTVEVTAPQKFMFIHQPCSAGSLYDINIKVKSDNFPRHIPYISLASNLTGQRVTGHSVEVEVVNDVVCDLSFNSSECPSSSCELGGVNMVNGDAEMVPEALKKVRKYGPLSKKKTRKLSSLTASKRPSESGMLKRPDVACVPLNVVFGRINAVLGLTSEDEGPTR
ncbi:uncharacterized protein At1g51745-like [Bidens hawaiensis]|uniref:uncharacterized protein At1g51745-like n=1 Tax=Bidens hawaiensis TaxID=980011 RepID=UPI00404B3117